MENNDLSKQDLQRMAPNACLGFLGTAAHGLAVNMQENLYGRPNLWAGAVEKIEKVIGMRPDFMTSFTAPLAMMQLLQMVCVMGQVNSEKYHKPEREKLFKIVKYLAPIAVAVVFVGYELSGVHLNGTEYLDNPMADNLATMVALGISMVTAVVSEKIFWEKDSKSDN